MSEVVFRELVGRINEPADEVSAGFSASLGLDFVWKKDTNDKLSFYSFGVRRKNLAFGLWRGVCHRADLRTSSQPELLRAHYPDAPAHIVALPPVDVSNIIQLPTPGYHVGKAVISEPKNHTFRFCRKYLPYNGFCQVKLNGRRRPL